MIYECYKKGRGGEGVIVGGAGIECGAETVRRDKKTMR